MVYRQTKRMWEDGTGWVTTEFVVSDIYADLFSQPDVIDIDIIKFNSTKQDLEKSGSQKEDEFNFEVSDAKIKNTDEQDCRDFILQAETEKRWAALFVYESTPYTSGEVAQLKFSGKLRDKISATNIFSSGSQWGANPNPQRNWKLSAQSLGAAVTDIINLRDKTVDGAVVEGILTEMAGDAAWIAANVGNSRSYATYADFYTKNMVNLNAGLDKLRALAEARVQVDIPEFELSFKSSLSGFWFIPSKAKTTPGPHSHFSGWENNTTQKTRLNLLDAVETENVPLVNINLFITGYGITDSAKNKSQKALEYDFSFEKYDNFKNLLYALAPCFGCFCIFRNLTATHLEVEFVPYGDAQKDRVYLCDFISGELDLQTEKITEKRYKGRANNAAVEGSDTYTVDSNTQDTVISFSDKYKKGDDEKGDLIPLTLSPTLKNSKQVENEKIRPHNHFGSNYSKNGPYFIHTAIYIRYLQGGILDVATPAFQVAVSIDGEEMIFDTLAGCLNALDGRNGTIHSTEYKRKVQWVSRFSLSSDGSAQSWKNLTIGSEYIEDGRSYIVAGIEQDWDKFETSLRLTRSSKYGFGEPVSEVIDDSYGGYTQYLSPPAGFAGEALTSGLAAVIKSDGEIYKMTGRHEDYGKYAGVVLNEPSEGDDVYLQKDDVLYNINWNFTPGQLVYVRTSGGMNLSHESIIEKTTTEDLTICIGIAISAQQIKLEKMFEKIIYPPLPDIV